MDVRIAGDLILDRTTVTCHTSRFSKRSDVQKLVEETFRVMGKLDVGISNAAWTQIVNVYDLEQNIDETDWDNVSQSTLRHTWDYFTQPSDTWT